MTASEADLVPFPSLAEIAPGELLETSLSASTTTSTHGLHRFPAKFIPQVPRWAMREFADSTSTVLDPFMGSGTTLVEGESRVRRVIGTDIDPLAVLISRAKTASIRSERVLQLLDWVQRRATSDAAPQLGLPMAGVQNALHWFEKPAMDQLGALMRAIDAVEATDDERTVLLAIFSSIIRRVSRADDQSQKTYVSGTLPKNPPPVFPTFERAGRRAVVGFAEAEGKRTADVQALLGSALDIPLSPKSVDLIVTSPPYLDSVDYMYNLMLEYFWLGPRLEVPDRPTFNLLRRRSIDHEQQDSKSMAAVRRISAEASIAEYRRSSLVAYLQLMQRHFIEASRVLRPDGHYVFVLGNSLSGGSQLPVADWMIQLAAGAGLQVDKAFAYRIRRHYMKFPRKGRGGIILADWVITLRHAAKPRVETLPPLHLSIGDDQVAH